MKYLNKYNVIFIIGFVLWIGTTAAFGFNDKPESALERMTDFISAVLMIWGIIGDILQGVTIHKNTTYNETHNITTDKVDLNPQFTGKPKVEKTDKGIKISADKGSEE